MFVSESHIYGIENVPRYLGKYHHYELYDENKTYEKINTIDYGHGLNSYENHLVTIDKVKYVYVTEYITAEELMKISIYCPCVRCTSKWYHISSYFICSCCVGCLKSIFPNSLYFKQARETYATNNLLR